jgi:VCBS repeat protein
MRPLCAVVIVAAVCAAPPASAKPKRPPKPPAAALPAVPQVAVLRLADGWRADLSFDGGLLGWALPRSRDGQRALLLLVGPKRGVVPTGAAPSCGVREADSQPTHDASLYRWRVASPEHLESLGSGLPSGDLESADLDDDGEDELLLVRDGRIDLVTASAQGPAEIHPLVVDSKLGVSCCGSCVTWDGFPMQDNALRVALVGAFRTYGRRPDGAVAFRSELGTPKRVTGGSERVTVRSPAVRPIGRTAAGRMVYATDPEALGRRRLRTLLLDPDGPAEARAVESWAMFPEPERMVDNAFAMLQGSPVLIVTTTLADKLSLFGEKALRVYPLGGERTRAGDAPMFATTTGINLWQQAYPAVVDLDGDGRDDLVLAYWKGLKNSIAALEVYRGTDSATFAKPRTTSFDVEGGERGFLEFGPDIDGDGRPDLLLLANRELLVFPGLAPGRALDRPVDSRPSRRIALPSDLPGAIGASFSMGFDGFQISRAPGGLGTPHLLDLNADGRPEAVFAGDGGNGGGRVTIVVVRGP